MRICTYGLNDTFWIEKIKIGHRKSSYWISAHIIGRNLGIKRRKSLCMPKSNNNVVILGWDGLGIGRRIRK